MNSTSDHARLIETFYTAFQRRDGAAMAACYHPEATFSDPVFPDLKGPEVGAMWRMLTERATSLEVTFRDVKAEGQGGSAHWEAVYPFSATGKRVHNIIDATFEFRDGKIFRHVDRFDFYRWTRMALGLPGVLLGWSPMLQGSIRKKARAGLDAFMKKG